MSVIHPGLLLLIERFPDRRDDLRHLYYKDENVKSIFDNYQKCFEAIRFWAESEHECALDRHREYCALLDELETDILHYQSDDFEAGLSQGNNLN